jgi:hydrophobe/amphiphile efflux-3 (HAE3) family protein
MSDRFARIAGWCVERPVPVLAATALVALIAAVGALRLEAEAGTDQFVDRGSTTYDATQDFKGKFGDDPVAVLVEGNLRDLVLTSNLGKLLALEGCLGGNAPGGQVFTDEPAPAPCAAIAEAKPAQVVYGPGTFLNQFATQASRLLNQQSNAAVEQAREAATRAAGRARREGLSEEDQQAAARAAASEVITGFYQQVQELALRYGQSGLPSIDSPTFVSSVVFDPRRPGQPKPKFAYLFPNANSALISVRLRPDLSDSERDEAIELILDAVADPSFQIKNANYVVGGVPVVLTDLADGLSDKVLVLLAIAFCVMAIALLALLRPPLRLLPLAIALGSAALTFGGLAAMGGSLTLAALAVVPVLIGLAVDYAIQFQARFAEAREGDASPPAAAVEAAARGARNIATAVVATGAGFLVLLLWPAPVIRSFGLMLLAGIAIAFALTITAGLAALSLTAPEPRSRRRVPARVAGQAARAASAWRALALRPRALAKRAVGASMARSGRVLALGVVLAAVGWIVGSRTEVTADIRTLLPPDLQAFQDIDELERGTGVSGEVDVTVNASDLTDPAVIAWMRDYKERVLDDAGFSTGPSSCIEQQADLCPSIALPDLFDAGEAVPSRNRIREILSLLPPYFAQAVVDRDPETGGIGHTAVISFGIKVMPFDDQKALVDRIRDEIDPPGTAADPPPGVSAEVVGLPVLIADASADLGRDRYLFTLYGVLAVALALLAVYRSVRRALVPLVPVALATGWSSLALWVLGLDLNPMSATLGALVIAIATEFSVLLAARYEEERRAGAALGDAIRGAYSRTGTAVAASGITAIAGFAVLGVSDVPMIRDFGLLTVLDLALALAGVLIALPATIVWAESGFAPFGALRVRRGRPAAATDAG